MQEQFQCPACDADDWERTADYRYGKGDAVASDYVSLRRRILFEVWFPGRDEVVLTSVLCRSCGFMTYAPRPSAADLDAKYRFLQQTEKHIGGRGTSPQALSVAKRRADALYRTVRSRLGGELRVLDVGGGDGKLLVPFRDAGCQCDLVDYNENPLDGIRRIGNTITDVPADARYDVIVCSHVLEHLAEPAFVVREMARRLTAAGIVYGEVPLGVWRGIGIASEPVTHVNFFTVGSFATMFARCGLGVETARARVGIYNKRIDVIALVARPLAEGEATVVPTNTVAEARRLLAPSPMMRARQMIRLRRLPPFSAVLRKFGLAR